MTSEQMGLTTLGPHPNAGMLFVAAAGNSGLNNDTYPQYPSSYNLDNIIAVAAAARGSYALLMFGLAVSIPLIMAGAAIVIALLERFPVIVWAGAALLGWIAGEIIAGDPLFTQHLDQATAHSVHLGAAMAGALLVLLIGVVRRRLSRRSAPDRV